MEGRRVEGVFLDTAILRNRAYEAYETAKVFQIKILSQIPKALLSSLGSLGSRLKATVKSAEGNKLILLLENGYEIEAENRLSLPVKPGDELTLILESENPLTLRLERVSSKLRGVGDLIKKALESFTPLLNPSDPKGFLKNSGLIYEKKVWDFLRGVLKEEDLVSDNKYAVLKTLYERDLPRIEKALGEFLSKEKLTELFGGKERKDLIRNLPKLETLLSEAREAKLQELNHLKAVVREVVRGLIGSLTEKATLLGLKPSLQEEVISNLEANPKSVDILREALKSIEQNRYEEFRSKLSLLGVKLEEAHRLPQVKDKLVASLKELIKGATAVLKKELGSEDPQELVSKMRELERELKTLEEASARLKELPPNLRENLSKLEAINQLQVFLLTSLGRKFVVPFRTDEGKGVFAFSAEDTFRILIKLNFEEGFLGVSVEAPRRENPERISVLFKTDIPTLEEEIEKSLPSLIEELEELGLEVKSEVLKSSEREFEEEVTSLLGGEGSFNLRV